VEKLQDTSSHLPVVSPTNNHEAQNSQLVEIAIAVQPCNHRHDDVAKVDELCASVVRPLPAMVVRTLGTAASCQNPGHNENIGFPILRSRLRMFSCTNWGSPWRTNLLTWTRSRPTTRSTSPPYGQCSVGQFVPSSR
jgi:hypothetical protein